MFIVTYVEHLQVIITMTMYKKNLLKCVKKCRLFAKNKREREMNCSTRCPWRGHASRCVQRVSEPQQCRLLRNKEKQLIFSLMALHFMCYPKGIRKSQIVG